MRKGFYLGLFLLFLIVGISMTVNAQGERTVYHQIPAIEKSIGYAQAVRVDSMLYISGTVGYDAFGLMPDDMKSQLKNAYLNIEAVLKHFDLGFQDVVMERIYTPRMDELKKAENLAVRKGFYGGAYPATTWVEVKGLYEPAALLEIEVIAEIPD